MNQLKGTGAAAVMNGELNDGIIDELSRYMAEASDQPLPDAALEKCRLHVLDTIASAISGTDLLPGQKAIALARIEQGRPEATVLGTEFRTDPATAAFTNAMMAQADETDDSHSDSRSHPGCGVIPAALAAAERFGGTGDQFLRAVALGYDVGTRVVQALGTGKLYDAGHATHAFSGVFGAAAAAGSMARFSPQQFRWLLSYTAQQTAGITSWRRDTDHIEKAFVFGGMPARNGVSTALMIAAGFTGVADVFSGPRNFFIAYGREPDPDILVDALGEHYALMATTIKKWSVGSPSQPVLDMGLELVEQHNVIAENVQHIRLRMSLRESVVDNQKMPDINVKHLLSLMLVDGELTFASSHDVKRMDDPALLAFQEKIELIFDPEIRFRKPAIELQRTDGQTISLKADDVRGSPANPMSREEVIAKANGLIAPRLSQAAADRLVDVVWNLGEDDDAAEQIVRSVSP